MLQTLQQTINHKILRIDILMIFSLLNQDKLTEITETSWNTPRKILSVRILCLNSNTGKDQIRNHSNYSINNKPLALSENLEQGNTRFLQLKTTHPTVVGGW